MPAPRRLFMYSSLIALALTQQAHAAGFQLKEQGAGVQGLSFAGATAKADDMSTLFFNPAGMTRLKGDRAEITATYILPSAKLTMSNVTAATVGGTGKPTINDGNGGDAGVGTLVPALYAKKQLNNDWSLGVSVNTPFGLSTSYDDGWAGRYYALDSELKTINVSPMLAYRVNNNLSVGGGVQVQHISAMLTKAVNFAAFVPGAPDGQSKLVGQDYGLGYSLGALYEFSPKSRIGVSYRSRVSHQVEGRVEVSNVPGAVAGNANFQTADATASLTTPDVLSIGGYHALNDKWALMADLSWTNWSVFDNLIVTNKSNGTVRENIAEHWHDTWFLALGTEFKPNEKDTWQFGVAYDEGAAPTQNRTFRIPDTDRIWTSVGYQRKLSEFSNVGVGYSHIFGKKARVNEVGTPTVAGTINGEFDAHVDILSVNFAYKF